MNRDMKKSVWTFVLLLLSAYGAYCFYEANQVGTHSGRVWLHRTNSLEKMREKEVRFPNFEVDLVWRDKGVFDVTHDEDTTFNLSLESYLPEVAADRDSVWLDIKNLTLANTDTALAVLNQLCEEYGISKRQLIVESRCEAALAQFTADSFYTSFYVDLPRPSGLDADEQVTCLDSLQRVVNRNKVCALSFPVYWYQEIADNIEGSIDFLTWANHTPEYGLYADLYFKEILNDERVKVILVKSKGKYHR